MIRANWSAERQNSQIDFVNVCQIGELKAQREKSNWNALDSVVGDAKGMHKELKLNYTLV